MIIGGELMDNFYEQLVTSEKSLTYKVANVMVYGLGVLAFLSLLFRQIFLAIILIAVAVGLFFLKKNLFVEYEYAFTNGEIDIDKILEMKKRKRVLTFQIKDVEILAKESSDEINNFSNKPNKVLDLYPTNYNGELFVAVLNKGAEKVMLRFVPDEKFLSLSFKYNPKAVKKNK